MNKITLMGRLTATPELKTTPNGTNVCTFTLAVQREYVSNGSERETDFIDCVAWRGTAEFIAKYFSKGSMIAVCGSLQTRTYTDKNGNNRKVCEAVVSNAYFTGEKKADRQSDAADTNFSDTNVSAIESIDIDDDDLPF